MNHSPDMGQTETKGEPMTTPEATVNGRTVAFGELPPHTTALDWIRNLGFTGAKEG